MRIAIITAGDPNDKKGAFIATHQRIKHLIDHGMEVDVFIIRNYESKLIQLLRKKRYQKEDREDFFVYDDIKYNNLWIPFALSDYIQRQKLNQLGSVFIRYAKKWSRLFADYKLISAHSLEPAIIAMFARDQFGVPFTVTWHGSDIHSMPGMNSSFKTMTLKVCSVASAVFFVSKQLQTDAAKLGINVSNTHVLYNAVDQNQFRPYSFEERESLKIAKKIDGVFNIGFIGGLVAVKNCQILPGLFKKIADNIKNVKFYFVGDGKLRSGISEECREFDLNVVFMGNLLQKDMPDIINCLDLVVLPSINEGMPLIVLECVACQIPIVTSRVGGIPEVLNNEYTIEHGPGFVERYAEIVINLLRKPDKESIELPAMFSWEQTSAKEAAIYREILKS